MSYEFKQIHSGPFWETIARDFPRRSAGEAFARDYFARLGYEILDLEHDNANDAIDIMATRNGNAYQFAVEKTRA